MLTELDQQLILINLEEIQELTTMEPGNTRVQIAMVNSRFAIIWHETINNNRWPCGSFNKKFSDWVGLHSLSGVREQLKPHLNGHTWKQIERRYRSIIHE
jgi:hypothetical protein